MPVTGLRWLEFTSATRLHAQLIPANFTSCAGVNEHDPADPGSPVAANAVAPGLQTLSTDSPIAWTEPYNWVPALVELNVDTTPRKVVTRE